MELLHKTCAGLDVHKATVVACVRRVVRAKAETEVRTFATTTAELIALGEWLTSEGVTCAAMEATGIYWKPVWHILSDEDFELILVNAAHVKNVPGRKTDVNDATWLAELVAHGLVKASFVPPREVDDLRTLMRTRKQFVRERVSHVQRIQKTLETANIKLDSVISDIVGQSGRAMLEGLIAGEADPLKLASLGNRRLRATPAELAAALNGRVTEHHRMILRLHLDHIDAIDKALAAIDARAGATLDPFRVAAELIETVHGVGALAARGIIGEIGIDMSRFPTDGNLLSSCRRHAFRHGGWPRASQRRERGQAPLDTAAQGRHLVEDAARSMRLGSGAQKGHLPQRSVLPPQRQSRRQESDHGGCRIDPDCHLPHAPNRRDLPRSGRPIPPEPIDLTADQTPHQTPRSSRLQSRINPYPNRLIRGCFFLDPEGQTPNTFHAAGICRQPLLSHYERGVPRGPVERVTGRASAQALRYKTSQFASRSRHFRAREAQGGT